MGMTDTFRPIEYYRERLRDGGTRPLSYEDEPQRLAGQNMRLVFNRLGHDDELSGGGLIGLVEASRRFDASRGSKFTTYASYWIRQASRRWGEAPNKPVHIPEHIFAMLSFMGPPTKEQKDMLDSAKAVLDANVLSIDRRLDDRRHSDGWNPLIPTVRDPEPIEAETALSTARGRLREEFPKYASVIDRLFPEGPRAIPETCVSIARDAGVTTQAVHQWRDRGFRYLRRYLRNTYNPLRGGRTRW